MARCVTIILFASSTTSDVPKCLSVWATDYSCNITTVVCLRSSMKVEMYFVLLVILTATVMNCGQGKNIDFYSRNQHQGLNWGGSRRISHPAPLIWDPLLLVNDPVPHNWDPSPFCWDPHHNSVQFIFEYFFCTHDVLYKRSTSRSFCHLHLSVLGVDRCCKLQTLFKCHKSQTECLECSKTPDRRSETLPLLSTLRAQASALQASRL